MASSVSDICDEVRQNFFLYRCAPIAAPLLWRAAEAFLSLSEQRGSLDAAPRKIELFTSADQSTRTDDDLRSQRATRVLCSSATTLQQRSAGACRSGSRLMESARHGRKSLRIRAGSAWGADGLNYTVGDESYWVSRGGFFQVNRHMIDPLGRLGDGGKERRSCMGSLRWRRTVFACASDELRRSCRSRSRRRRSGAEAFRGKGRRAVAATTLEFPSAGRPSSASAWIWSSWTRRERASAPRYATLLARVRPTEIVYVSCDPVTLGTRPEAMVDSGYKLHRAAYGRHVSPDLSPGDRGGTETLMRASAE